MWSIFLTLKALLSLADFYRPDFGRFITQGMPQYQLVISPDLAVFSDYRHNVTIWASDSLYWFGLYRFNGDRREGAFSCSIASLAKRYCIYKKAECRAFHRSALGEVCLVTPLPWPRREIAHRQTPGFALKSQRSCSFTWDISERKAGKMPSSPVCLPRC